MPEVHRTTILQVIPEIDTGGSEQSTIDIARAVLSAGGRALVASEGGRLERELIAAGGEAIRMPTGAKNPLTILANARRLVQLIRAERVDLIHARSRAPAWSARIAARRTGIPFVTTFHGAYTERNAIKKLYNSIMARADHVIANSRYTADLVRQRYGVGADRLSIIFRGVDAAQFVPDAVSADRIAAVRARWGVAPSDKVVLLAARLSPIKGQVHLVAAARLLRDTYKMTGFSVVLAGSEQGRDEYAKGLRDQIAEAGLGNVVYMVGHEADMPAAQLASHVALLISTVPETFGRVLAEAGAMRCPVIASNIGAPQEILLTAPAVTAAEATGWLVPPGDPAALAEALAAALRLDPAEQRAMGERARRHVMSHFTLARMQAETLQVYDRLLGTGLAAALRQAPSADQLIAATKT